jgi:cytosine/adenosine deaminase-related metal-dependent hydrolase
MTGDGRTTLLANCHVLVTMDDSRRELAGGHVLVRGNAIEAVLPQAARPTDADVTVDLTGHVVLPGLVNTHHHMFQSLTRAVPGAQDCELFDWLRAHYPLWCRLTPDMIRVSALTAMAELMLSGCTTASDHLYLYPNGVRIDDEIDAAATIGLRFHPTARRMSMGESKGGLPPGPADRGRERDPARDAARNRALSRSAAVQHAVGRRRTLFPIHRVGRPDARSSGARAIRARRMHTHLAEKPQGRRLQSRTVRQGSRHVCRGSRLARRRRVACALRAPRRCRNRHVRADAHGGRALPDVEHATRLRQSRRCAG